MPPLNNSITSPFKDMSGSNKCVFTFNTEKVAGMTRFGKVNFLMTQGSELFSFNLNDFNNLGLYLITIKYISNWQS